MKRNGIVLLMSALMLLSAAVYISGCSQPASNSSQNQSNQNNQGQSGNQGNQGNQGGGINQGGTQTGIKGVWEIKKMGSTTYPVMEDGVELRIYYYIKSGKIIMAYKKGGTVLKGEEASYTLSGNTIKITTSSGLETTTYSISGSSLKITGSDGTLIECMRVTSPTAQEIESAPPY